MAIHVYVCGKGHRHEVLEPASEDNTGKVCGAVCEVSSCKSFHRCGRFVQLSAAVTTAPPKFRKGVGGFYAPTNTE
jgi:hypothetical protein